MTKLTDYRKDTPPERRLRELQNLLWSKPGSITFWIGAGFGKLYADLPVWGELLTQLAGEVSDESKKSIVDSLIAHGHLQVAAELLSELEGKQLTQRVCKLFQSEDCDVTDNPLCMVHPGTVITTNYDTVLERIFPEYKLVTPRDSIESIFNFAPKLVKLHGSVDEPDSIILNVSSYAKAYDKEFEWFLAHIFQNTTVLFIGCGLAEAEPYMKLIRLLSESKYLKGHHYAVMPFGALGSEKQTNDLIRDRSNELETIGIRTLPYIVNNADDHNFVKEVLYALRPQSADSVSALIRSLDEALDAFGPVNVGPALFRLYNSLEQKRIQQKPFLSLTMKFLRALREEERHDLGRLWSNQVGALIDYHEATTRRDYAEELKKGPEGSSKAKEILDNKAFFYDSSPRKKQFED